MSIIEKVLGEARCYWNSRVILSAAELDIFTRLHENPIACDELARSCGCDARALRRLLDCLITSGLLEKRESRYVPTETGMYLSARHPESILPMVLHLNTVWRNWDKLTETVRNGYNPVLEPVLDSPHPHETEAFVGAMHVVGRDIAGEIAGYCDLSGFQRLLDIGGASGTYTIAFLQENPQLEAVLFDLPGVIPMAEQRLRHAGLFDRVRLAAGDFYRDELPGGCDVALLSAIIHQNSQSENIALLRKVYRALSPGGALIIRDHVMDETRTKPASGALFALNMLVNTSGGDTYTFSEIENMLKTSGFTAISRLRKGEGMDSLVDARKPLQHTAEKRDIRRE